MIQKVFNTRKITTLARFRDRFTLLEPLSEKDMKILTLKQNSEKFVFSTTYGNIIKKNDIHLFGDIDFNNETDLKFLKRYKKEILNDEDDNMCYSTFDYDKGTIESNPKKDTPDFHCYMQYPILVDWLKWFKYNYCLIGKPKYCIIYSIPNKTPYGK